MSQDLYEDELTADREAIAAVLSGVAGGIRTGAVRFGESTDAVTVDTPEELTLEIELETDDDETSLELELEWTGSAEVSHGSSLDLTAEGDVETATVESDVEAVSVEGEIEAGTVESDVETDTVESDVEAVTSDHRPDTPRSLAQFEVYKARDDEWCWRLRHRNGNVIATSGEGYTRKHNALKGLRSVMTNSAEATITGGFPD